MARAPRAGRGPGRGRAGEGSGAANPRNEPTRKSSSQREAVNATRRQMPDIGKRREAAKRTNFKPLAMNEISRANAHRQPPDPYIYTDIKLPNRVVGQHSNGDHSIVYRHPAQLLPQIVP
jgi:hypothetical protein